jgi:hypothetical protein
MELIDSRQAIADACGALLREMDDYLPEAAHIVAAIDALIVARLADLADFVRWEPFSTSGEDYLNRERALTESKDKAT